MPRIAEFAACLVVACAVPTFADDCPEPVGRWAYGSAKSVVVLGTHAYVGASTYDGASSALFVMDVSNPDAPRVVGQAPLHEVFRIYDVAVAGSFAYVATQVGLSVVDVSTPSSPLEVGFVGTNSAAAVAVSGSHAFVADNYGRTMQVFDVSTPSSPVQVGILDLPGTPQGLTVAGNHAYVADSLGLRVIDVSTPSAPVAGSGFHAIGCRPWINSCNWAWESA